MRKLIFVAEISVGKTNHNPCDLIDAARRHADHLGRAGIIAKSGQTNKRFMKKGYLRLPFSSRAMRERFIDRVEEHCDPAVKIRRLIHRSLG